MQAFSLCPAAALRPLRGVLTDIDDTLTLDGRIAPEAWRALQALQAGGVPVIAITGRPAGWSEQFALTWPVAAIVAENGAVLLSRDAQGQLLRDFAQDEVTRAVNFERLQGCAADILQRVPGSRLATDSAGRLTDIAVDHSEHAHLPPAQVAEVCALMREHGLRATVSSIHINGWIGEHSKWSAAQWAVPHRLGLAFVADEWVYVGDSSNDELMFEHMPLSVGVANLQRFLPQMHWRPSYLTAGERGQGFAEMATALLAARQGEAA
ncbi:HAD family hydrolase [Roseateles koreensis]|uniref:HAD-IIB family hydrolase n=1 Tax=Roseateles koreensis TaxID=2987526 RepID=A0ABT5KQI6_9BURK|nr:HAD-IIB family hydrolase [Roseateles koreensis]MDC8784628.1 HAD-IIB family hydrolase [Roseateles koreensis]